MRLKFIEYIINAACCECRCGARGGSLVHLKLETRNAYLESFVKIVSRCKQYNSMQLQSNVNSHKQNGKDWRTIFQTRHEIFNGSELNRDGKVNFLISGDVSFSVESAGKGNTGLLISVIYFGTSQTHPRSIPKYPANPFSQSRTLETSHLPLGCFSCLTLIQLKTSDDRAKQRRIDHENFNWCYRYERG